MTRKEQIERAAKIRADQYSHPVIWHDCYCHFIEGAKWADKSIIKSANGNDLPEIDREVIAILDNGKVVYAHRPKEYWDGKSISTGKVTRYYPKRYDKGGWNMPDVKYWLDIDISFIKELKGE